MSKKLTYEFVKSEFEKIDYKLLEGKYINNQTKMKYICDKGHEGYTTYSNFHQGRKCKQCVINKQKLDYNFVKQEFKKRGYKLLETEYKNAFTKMKYKCSKGHINFIIYNSFQRGRGCKKCFYINNSGKNNNYWNPNRNQVKVNKKMRELCMSLLRRTLITLDQKKSDKTYKLLGYNSKQLQDHLQNFSNYKTLKDKKWHLDHIIPVKAFVEYNILDLKIINHLSNLQPLEYKTNIKKSGKYRKKDFHKYMEQFPKWKYNKQIFKYEKFK